MSLEMSKFYAGARAVVVNQPNAVDRSMLPTLYQVKPKNKQKIVTPPNKKTLNNLKVGNGESRASAGPSKNSTPLTSGRNKSNSVAAASAVRKVGIKEVSFLSRNKNQDKPVLNTSIMQNQRKHITHNSNQRLYQLRHKSIFSQGRRLSSQGVACNSMCQPDLKWIMRPLRNFKSQSDSSSEVNGICKLKCKEKLEPASYLTVKTSWPNDVRRCRRLRTTDPKGQESKHSRVFCVPSQRIMLVDQLKQAQVHQVKAKRMRSQHKEQLKASKREQNQCVQPEKPSALEMYEVEETTSVIHNSEISKKQHEEELLTIKENCGLNQKVSIGCTSVSSGSYQTTIACSSTSCHQSDSIGKMWCCDQKYDSPIIEHNGNSKSIKLTSTVIKIIPESSVEKNVAIPVQRNPIKIPSSHGPGTQLNTPQHKPVSLPQLVTCTPTPKIVRVEQHKIPRTMEDGIDMSYQYFVSTPLKRGKRPQTIRYLYRPMVRSLNNSPTKQLKRLKRNHANIMNSDNKGTLRDELEVPLPLNTPLPISMQVPEPEQHTFKPPPLKINAKYRPLLEKLSKMPFPTEMPKERMKQGGSGDAHLKRLALPSVGMPATQLVMEAQDSEIQPSLMDYHPNATRLDSKSGAYISYHAPLHFQRMTGGRAAYDTRNPDTGSSFLLSDAFSPTIAAVTFDDIELQISQQPSTNKCVSFQLTDLCSSSISSRVALDKKSCKKRKVNTNRKSKSKVAKKAESKGRK